MAAAFRPQDRIHYPLRAPLEEINPTLSHLKARWPISSHKLLSFTTQNPQKPDYSYGRHKPSRGDEDLVVLNLYRWVQYHFHLKYPSNFILEQLNLRLTTQLGFRLFRHCI